MKTDLEPTPAAVLVGLAGLGLLTAAGMPMQEQRLPVWARVAFAAGAVLWVLLVVHRPPSREDLAPLDERARGPRLVLLALAIALAVVAWRSSAAGTYRLSNVAPWLGATVCWLGAWLHRPREGRLFEPSDRRGRPLRLFALAGIVAVGAVFLFYRLAETPGNPYSDHAEKLLDVLDVQNGARPVFFIRNTGREPFQFYWTFALMELFGLPAHYLTLKIGTALIGLLAIPALYLLGREMGGTRLGLAVAALAAWSKWPVSLARNGLRYTLAVLPTVVVLWALLRYLRRGDRASILWAGIALGIGIQGYSTFRIVPLLAIAIAGLALFDRRRRGRRSEIAVDAIALAGTAFLAALPLVHYVVRHLDQFWFRAGTRVASLERPIEGEPVAIFARNLGNMLLAFNWKGSSSWVLVRLSEPFLDAVTAAFWIAGLVLLTALLARRSIRWAALPIAFLILTLPSTLSIAFPDENPSINRAGTAIPVVFLVAALPVAYLTSSRRAASTGLGAVGVGALMLFSIERNYRQYFVGFHRQYDQMIDHSLAMARTLDEFRRQGVPLDQMYLLYTDYWVDGRNIGLELDAPAWADTHVIAPGQLPKGLTRRPLVFLHMPANPIVKELDRTYPGKDRIVRQSFSDRDFAVYYSP